MSEEESVDSSSSEEESFTLLKDFNPDDFMLDSGGTYNTYIDYSSEDTNGNQLSPDLYVMEILLSKSDILFGSDSSDSNSSDDDDSSVAIVTNKKRLGPSRRCTRKRKKKNLASEIAPIFSKLQGQIYV